MNCEEALRWIWEVRHENEEPVGSLADHLDSCDACGAELAARRQIGAGLRGLRNFYDEVPPEGIDDSVLEAAHAAVLARESGAFHVELDPELAAITGSVPTELARAIQAEIAADLPTTGRVPLRPEDLAGLEDRPDWGAPREPAARSWQPPRASIAWMVAAALLLGGALSIGFLAGRATAPALDSTLALARPASAIVLPDRPRVHSVGLSRDSLNNVETGNTYLLSGPVGGPYEVVGVVSWENANLLPMPMADQEEIVVALGPAGGWSRGKLLALNDLQSNDVEILGRRAVDRY